MLYRFAFVFLLLFSSAAFAEDVTILDAYENTGTCENSGAIIMPGETQHLDIICHKAFMIDNSDHSAAVEFINDKDNIIVIRGIQDKKNSRVLHIKMLIMGDNEIPVKGYCGSSSETKQISCALVFQLIPGYVVINFNWEDEWKDVTESFKKGVGTKK